MKKQTKQRKQKGDKTFSDAEVLAAVLSTKSYAEAARFLGCNKTTITRRLKDPDLYSQLLQHRQKVLSVVTQNMITRLSEAIDVLYELMLHSENDLVRQNAARDFILHAERLIETENITDRIHRMEIEERMRKAKEIEET